MSEQKHTPGPWRTDDDCPDGEIEIVDADGNTLATVECVDGCPEGIANADLMAAAPDLFAELRETADWLTERGSYLRDLAKLTGVRADRAQWLREESARFEGRAAVIRQTIIKATQGA